MSPKNSPAGKLDDKLTKSLQEQVDEIADKKINMLIEEKVKKLVQDGELNKKIETKVKEQDNSEEIYKVLYILITYILGLIQFN